MLTLCELDIGNQVAQTLQGLGVAEKTSLRTAERLEGPSLRAEPVRKLQRRTRGSTLMLPPGQGFFFRLTLNAPFIASTDGEPTPAGSRPDRAHPPGANARARRRRCLLAPPQVEPLVQSSRRPV